MNCPSSKTFALRTLFTLSFVCMFLLEDDFQKKTKPAFPVTSRLIKAALVPDWSPLIATIAEILPAEWETGRLRRVEPDFSVGQPRSSLEIVLHIIFHIHCRKTTMLHKLLLKYHQLNLSLNRNDGRTKGTCAG